MKSKGALRFNLNLYMVSTFFKYDCLMVARSKNIGKT
jgi:hypothetical protein